MESFTVAICTRNRASLLRRCLRGLEETLESLDVDIVVVDNGSTDTTTEVVTLFESRVRLVSETNVGLSNARNRAVSECGSEYIVFLDDDGIPEKTWGPAVAEITRRGQADVFGGPYTPYYTSAKPDWFEDAFGSSHLDLIDGSQMDGVCFSGGNMGVRTALLRDLGGFDARLGMTGNRVGLGEETSLQRTLQRSKPSLRFEFSSLMKIKHHVSAAKMRLLYIYKRNFIYGYSLLDIDPHDNVHRLGFARVIQQTKLGIPLIVRLVLRDRQKYRHWHTYAATYLTISSIFWGVQIRKFHDACRRLLPLD